MTPVTKTSNVAATNTVSVGSNQHEPDEDIALMLAFQAGDDRAFDTLYRKYRGRIFQFCRRMVRTEAVADEATQDVFVKLYRARARYRPQSKFTTFLYRIATNHCLNLKARKGFTPMEDKALHPTDACDEPEARVLAAERRQQVQAALDVLPKGQRAVVNLCHYDELSYREAAEVLGGTESSIKSTLFRARARLAKELRVLIEKEQAA